MLYRVLLDEEAEGDLADLYDYISRSGAEPNARGYVNRILKHLAGFAQFPLRGAARDDIRPGLRMVGFERRITIAYVVEGEDVVILRILYAGRQFPTEPKP